MNPFHHFTHALRGHRHGHHFGRRGPHGHGHDFPGPPGPPDGAGSRLGGFERGRKLGSDDLQLLILDLLCEQPRHGYELIKEIEQRSRGYYVPSPGMIYPALSFLEEIGQAIVEVEGAKKRYSITVPGLAHLDEHRGAVDATWAQLAWFGDRMARLREDAPAEDGFEARGGRRGRGAADELHAAIDALRGVLRERHRAGTDERRRIATILGEAVAAILRDARP